MNRIFRYLLKLYISDCIQMEDVDGKLIVIKIPNATTELIEVVAKDLESLIFDSKINCECIIVPDTWNLSTITNKTLLDMIKGVRHHESNS